MARAKRNVCRKCSEPVKVTKGEKIPTVTLDNVEYKLCYKHYIELYGWLKYEGNNILKEECRSDNT